MILADNKIVFSSQLSAFSFKMQRKEKFFYLGIGFLVFIITTLSLNAGLFHGLELFLEDTLFGRKPIDEKLIIVAIDDKSIQKIGQWPWPREIYASFIEILNPLKPRVLGIDVLLSEQSRVGSVDDLKLSNAIKRAEYPIVLGSQANNFSHNENGFFSSGFIFPLSVFLNAGATTGFVNVISSKDGVTRFFPSGNIESDSGALKPFTEEIAQKADIDVPKSEEDVNRIYFAGPTGSIRTMSFADVLSGEASGLQNKIILLGATAPSLHDTQKTPGSGNEEMAGVEIHGHILNMFLTDLTLENLPQTKHIAWMFLAALISSLLFIFIPRIEIAVGVNVFLGLIYLITAIVLFDKGTAVNIIHVALSWFLTSVFCSIYKSLSGEKEKQIIKKTFAKYVSPDVLDQLLKHPEKVALGGEEREITVLFSDIRGFTSISEKTTPQELVRILNTYFSAVTRAIIENAGVLDKYIGDAIMAFWGAPLLNENQADNAVEAGLQMLERLKEVNIELKAKGDPEIAIGIGIVTGMAVVGNVGSEHRFDYTAIGDTVNASWRRGGAPQAYKFENFNRAYTPQRNKYKKKI